MTGSTPTPTATDEGEGTTVTIPTTAPGPAAQDCPPAGLDVAAVPEEELVAATTVLEDAEDWDTREVARAVLEAAAWVRAHPERADEAPLRALAAAGLDRRVAWFPLVADAAATAVAFWGVLTGRLPALLDSTRWPHVAWLLAGSAALALLAGGAEDIGRCYRTARQTRRARRLAPKSDTPSEEVS